MEAALVAGCGSSSDTSQSQQAKPTQLRAVWGMPTNGAKPHALLLLIHGGGWVGQSAGGVQSELMLATIFQRYGYETLTFDYRRGASGVQDAEMFYELARKRVGPKLPICALGPSAGGHISLMLAVREPGLACVISFAGPTDLVSLANQPGGAGAYQLAVNAFGKANLATYSPALHASSIHAKVMLVYAQTDPIVPVAQAQEMARVLPSAKLIVLPPGPVGFVHSSVARQPYIQSLGAEASFLADAARTWHGG
jgi:acetyl esterase/lipase